MYTKKQFNWPKDTSLEEKAPVHVRFRVFDLYTSYCDKEYVVWVCNYYVVQYLYALTTFDSQLNEGTR